MPSGKVAKVVYHSMSDESSEGTTWIDTTDKTVNSLNLFANNTALGADGNDVTGNVNFNINNTDGTKTLGTITLNTSTGSITASYIDINTILFFDSFEDFPATGSELHLYVDKSDTTVWRWDDEEDMYKLLNEITTSWDTVITVSSWNAGSAASFSVASSSPTLTITNGTVPTLTTYPVDVVTYVTNGHSQGLM